MVFNICDAAKKTAHHDKVVDGEIKIKFEILRSQF